MIFKVSQVNKILHCMIYFVNFQIYGPRKYIKDVNTRADSNIQSSEIQVKQVGLHSN